MNEIMNEWLNIYLTDLAKNMRTDLVGPARWKNIVSFEIPKFKPE